MDNVTPISAKEVMRMQAEAAAHAQFALQFYQCAQPVCPKCSTTQPESTTKSPK